MSDIIQVNPLVFGGEGESVHANMLTKLWENPNPSADFGSQNITLASGDYDFRLILYRYFTGDTLTLSNIVAKEDKAILDCAFATSAGARSFTRQVNYVSATTLSIGDAQYATASTPATVANNFIIPVAVYGFKKSLDITAIVSNVSTDARLCMLSDGVTDVEKAIKIEMISGTMAALNASVNTSYPSGYDINNTIVLRAEVKNGSAWSNMLYGDVGIQVALFSTYISVYTRHADFVGLEYRVYLAKYRT